jgi:hypothetical protein
MKQLFDLQQVPTLQKVTLSSLYLEMIIFSDKLIAHSGDIKSNTFFSQLINPWQGGPIT